MSEPLTARDHALRVAAYEAAAVAFAAEYEKARAAAGPVFAALYEQGIDRQAVLLPDGEKLDRITIKGPSPAVEMPADGLLDWCREHFPVAIEEYIDPAAIDSTDVIEAVRAKVPDVIRQRVRPGTAKVLMKEIAESCGYLTDRRTGDPTPKVAEVSEGKATGAFSFTGGNAAERRERLMAELLNGSLRDLIGFGPLALPAPEEPA